MHGTGQVQLSPDHFIATGFVCFTKGREIKGSENHDHLSGLSSVVFFIQIDFRLDWMPQLCGQQSCYFVSKQQRNFSVVMSRKCLPSKREIAFSTAYWLTKLIFKEICIWTYITEYKNKASKQYSLRKLRDGFFSMSFWDLDVNRCLKWKCVSRLNDEASDRPKSK